jgi:hypothetical protein
MSDDPTPSLPGCQSARLAVLLDALDGMALFEAERASLRGWPDSRRTPWRTSRR